MFDYHRGRWLYDSIIMFTVRTKSKYGNEQKIYNGRVYHSKREALYAQELDLLKKAGEIKEWSPQFKLSLDVNGNHICNYYIDFYIIDKFGKEKIAEVKGYETAEWKLKWRLCKALFGEKYELVLIKEL